MGARHSDHAATPQGGIDRDGHKIDDRSPNRIEVLNTNASMLKAARPTANSPGAAVAEVGHCPVLLRGLPRERVLTSEPDGPALRA